MAAITIKEWCVTSYRLFFCIFTDLMKFSSGGSKKIAPRWLQIATVFAVGSISAALTFWNSVHSFELNCVEAMSLVHQIMAAKQTSKIYNKDSRLLCK